MVEDLCSSQRQSAQVSAAMPLSTTKEAVPGGNISLFLRRKKDLLEASVGSHEEPSIQSSPDKDNHDHNDNDPTCPIKTRETSQLSSSIIAAKPKFSWKRFIKRGRLYTKSRRTAVNEALYIRGLQDGRDSLLRSGSGGRKGSSMRNPRPPSALSSSSSMSGSPAFTSSIPFSSSSTSSMSLSSSAASVPRNPSMNSRRGCQSMPVRQIDSTKTAHNERLLGKASGCLQKYIRALKLTWLEQKGNHQQQKEGLQKKQEDYDCCLPSAAPRNRNKVADYEHACVEAEYGNAGNIYNGNDKRTIQESASHQLSRGGKACDGGDKPTIQQTTSCQQLYKGKNMTDELVKREWSWTTSFDENESLSAAFITIEPSRSSAASFNEESRPELHWVCGNISTTKGTKIENESFIQGAIAHCKTSRAIEFVGER